MRDVINEMMKKNKRISSPILKREKSETNNEIVYQGKFYFILFKIDINSSSFVVQPNAGMRSIAKLFNKYKNPKTHREQSELMKQNINNINSLKIFPLKKENIIFLFNSILF